MFLYLLYTRQNIFVLTMYYSKCDDKKFWFQFADLVIHDDLFEDSVDISEYVYWDYLYALHDRNNEDIRKGVPLYAPWYVHSNHMIAWILSGRKNMDICLCPDSNHHIFALPINGKTQCKYMITTQIILTCYAN